MAKNKRSEKLFDQYKWGVFKNLNPHVHRLINLLYLAVLALAVRIIAEMLFGSTSIIPSVIFRFSMVWAICYSFAAFPIIKTRFDAFQVSSWFGKSDWIDWSEMDFAIEKTTVRREYVLVGTKKLHLLYGVQSLISPKPFKRVFYIDSKIEGYEQVSARFLRAAEKNAKKQEKNFA